MSGRAETSQLHRRWREIVTRSRAAGKQGIDRCNLTITPLSSYRYLPELFAEHQIAVIASPPQFRPRQTDLRRRDGALEFDLQALGYPEFGPGPHCFGRTTRAGSSCGGAAA